MKKYWGIAILGMTALFLNRPGRQQSHRAGTEGSARESSRIQLRRHVGPLRGRGGPSCLRFEDGRYLFQERWLISRREDLTEGN